MHTSKNKLYEFRNLDQVIAVVATDQQQAEQAMTNRGYVIDNGRNNSFWLERVYVKSFNEIIIA